MSFLAFKPISKLRIAYKEAREKEELSWFIIVVIAIYYPFEEIILKLIPVPDLILVLLRAVPELLIYLLFFKLIWDILEKKKSWLKTPFEPIIIAFVIWTGVLTIINHASPIKVILGLRPLIKYIFLYYVVLYINLSREKIKILINYIIYIGIFEGILAFIQYFIPPVNELFIPDLIQVDIIDYTKATVATLGLAKTGSVVGTMGDAGVLSQFLIVPFILLVTVAYQQKPNKLFPSFKNILGILIIAFGVFATYKRAVLIIISIISLIILWHLNDKRGALKMIWLYCTSLFLAVLLAYILSLDVSAEFLGGRIREQEFDLLPYILQIFSPDYWQASAKGSRLLFFRVGCGGILGSGYWSGFSPDLSLVISNLAELASNSYDKAQFLLSGEQYYKDVYWCTMLSFYGIPGTLLFVMIFYRLYQLGKFLGERYSQNEYKTLGITTASMVIITSLYSFGERILEVRIYMFYYWLFAGMTMNIYLRHFLNQSFLITKKQAL